MQQVSEAPTEGRRRLEVRQRWGQSLLQVRHFDDGAAVTVGSDPGCDFQLFSERLGRRYTLVHPGGPGRVVAHPEGEALPLALGERVQVGLGAHSLEVRWTRPLPAPQSPLQERLDVRFTKVLLLTGLAAAVLAFAFSIWRSGAPEGDEAFFRHPAPYVVSLHRPVVAPPKRPALIERHAAAVAQASPARAAPPARAGASRPHPRDPSPLASLGLLGALNHLRGGLAGVALNTSIDGALGQLHGTSHGDGHGLDGVGVRGTTPGGDGPGPGIGSIGSIDGRGTSPTLEIGGPGRDTVRVQQGRTIVTGSLGREEIERVIKRHQSEIKFCYESALSQHPGLAGKVSVNFTIEGSGGISEASVVESTLPSPEVEQCILSRVHRWRFPEPQGGGVVVVTYPWIFQVAGSE